MKSIREELFNARRLYKNEKYSEALEKFDKYYTTNPQEFHKGFRYTYAWSIFRVHVENFSDEEELCQNVEKITELITQNDLNKEDFCLYTVSVLKVIRHFKNDENYSRLLYWLDKLNPMYLNDEESEYNGKAKQSDREYYFEVASIAYLNCYEYERCIEISTQALSSVSKFVGTAEIWHKWRIAKSLRALNRLHQSLEYLLEIVEQRPEWFIYREIADIYFRLGKSNESLKYICPAVLSKEPLSIKINMYYLIYQILNYMKSPLALVHAQLFYVYKSERGYQIPHEIEMLNIDADSLNLKDLESEVRQLWIRYKFRNQKIQYGTVSKFFQDKNYGFIINENDESIFFHEKDFDGDNVYVGQLVSFYTEENFDKSKNRKSLKAVNVRGE